LEKEVATNPTNFMQQFDLAQKLLQMGQTDRSFQVLDGILNSPQATIPMVMSVADAYNRLNQPLKLQAALERLSHLAPDSPEAWYDLAASHATLGQSAEAIQTLKKALDLNAKRAGQKTNDIRTTLMADQRFAPLRDNPEFKALLATH